MEEILQKYCQKRFSAILSPHLERIGSKNPIVTNILSVTYEDVKVPTENICECNGGHFVRFLIRIIFKDGKVIKCGSQCLLSMGYPNSLTSHIDKARIIVSNDIEKITNIAPETINTIAEIIQDKINLIVRNKYLPGLLFLKEFGEIIKGFINAGYSLPPWLINKFDEIISSTIKSITTTQIKKIEQNKQEFKEILEFCLQINQYIHGRSVFMQDLIAKINTGQQIDTRDINKITHIIKNYDPILLERTEKAIPFLYALTHIIDLRQADKQPMTGTNETFLMSLWRQVKYGVCLSLKQINTLIQKYNIYKNQYQQLAPNLQKTTQILVQKMFLLWEKEEINSQEKTEYIDIIEVLARRNIPVIAAFHQFIGGYNGSGNKCPEFKK